MSVNIDAHQAARLLAWYNILLSLFWSVLLLAPVVVFCFTSVAHQTVYLFIAVSIVFMFFPNRFLDKIQISKSTAIYKKLRVDWLNKFIQNGDWVNAIIKKQYPGYKAVSIRKNAVKKLLQQTYINEKFHFGMFVFLLLVSVHAFADQQWLWAAGITFTNILYNVYPNLLQQYIRVKLGIYHYQPRPNHQ